MAEAGDPDAAQIYVAVGAALSAWELAEEALAILCSVFSEIDDAKGQTAIRQIFGSIEFERRAAICPGKIIPNIFLSATR